MSGTGMGLSFLDGLFRFDVARGIYPEKGWRTDLHIGVFDAIHRDGNILAAQTDDEARALHLAFLRQHGVTEKDFNAAYDSKSVADNLQRAEQATANYAVASVPLLIVNGKYSTSVS